jgi:hypothetical protein
VRRQHRANTLAVLLLVAARSPKAPGRTVRVAAASDLALAFEELGKEFLLPTEQLRKK